MKNERLDVPLLLLLMWASFAAYAQVVAPPAQSGLSDGVIIALITSISTTVISLATLIVGVVKLNRVDEKITKTDERVELVHKATNSMKDALVADAEVRGQAQGVANEKVRKTASDALHAEAVLEGRTEAKAEAALKAEGAATAAAAKPAVDSGAPPEGSNADPLAVKVIAAVPVPVVETPSKAKP